MTVKKKVDKMLSHFVTPPFLCYINMLVAAPRLWSLSELSIF